MKKVLDVWSKIFERICHYLAYISMVFIVAMMLIMFVDSMCGLFFNYRFTGIYEIVQLMLCTLVFTSWAYTQSKFGHIHVTLFIAKFPRWLRFLCYGITAILSVITMIFGTIGVYKGLAEKLGNHEATGTLLIPLWPFYLFELAAYILFICILLAEAIKGILAIFREDFAEEIEAKWV